MKLDLDKSTWKRVTFGDMVKNVNDYFDPEVDGILPYVAGPHIHPGDATVATYGSTDDDDFPPTFKRKFEPGDVLLHSRGIEKLAAVDRAGVTGEKLFVLRSRDASTLSQRFLIWLLLSPAVVKHMKDNFTGSVNKFLNWGPLAAMEFDLPPLDEQERLADLLWAVERDCESQRRMLIAAQETMDRWMVSAVGAGTRAIRLGDLFESKIGGVWGKGPGESEVEVSVIRGTDISPAGEVDWAGAPRRSIKSSEAQSRLLRVGDVLIEKSGGSPNQPVGKVGVVQHVEGAAVPGNFVLLGRANPGLVRPRFLFLLLRGMWRRGNFAAYTGKTTNISNLRTRELLEASMTVPSLDRQDELIDQLEKLYEITHLTTTSGEAATSLRAAISNSIFGGN